ncbi:DNA-3-methyladenine glycosylase 2 family protein [Adhaeribacter sp. BT258]|uniref:DNA-3-methyladenine glycosylase II n=1 Tax=Adhaeribacter terrigena TaxID=2793070 RepID=A0ABS1C800_9BACT|nr:DNA-3-methyladenine glycosylase [Adhaeribacter terrigena]MBK0404720.1 DNA-3-methyladenine glycosylase 2 family protein [Adhaeribacter terrigena]
MPYQKAIAHLNSDPVIAELIISLPPIPPKPKEPDFYLTLLRSVVGQQLSVKAAATIYARFINLFPSTYPNPEEVLLLLDEQLRGVGLSGQKSGYVRAVAEFKKSGKLEPEVISHLDDEALIKHLTSIKGVGRWTAEMLLMFALDRPDVFPADDLGIQNAMKKRYGLTSEKKVLRQQMFEIAENWKPYRTLASKYLWKSLDNMPG